MNLDQTLLTLSFNIYIVLAIGYNLVSIIAKDIVGRSLAPTDPITGITIVGALYALFLVVDKMPLFSIVIVFGAFIYLIVRFGIFQHLLNYDAQKYFSRFSWAAAFLINIFGIAVLAQLIAKEIF